MTAKVLESAIPEHLHVPRTCPARMPPEYEPSFPAYCARFSPSVNDVVMAIIGAQHQNTDVEAATNAKALQQILSFVKGSTSDSPKHFDIASVTDAQGWYNEVVIAYWDDKVKFDSWKSASGFDSWWKGLDPKQEQNGWFQETFLPSMDRVETIYSDVNPGTSPEAHGAMSDHMSGLIREHVYWGSMRDRLPVSQTDELVGEKADNANLQSDTISTRIQIPGKQNLCIIRSGQDWSKTNLEERPLYLDTMHPVLIEGMDFLRDHGDQVGCYSCRLMKIIDANSLSSDTDQTFGLAYFDDIASLEKWSKEHKTHLKIFGGFLKYVKKLDMNITLRLYHEVFVLKPEQQYFEYVGCHPGTGMLGGLNQRS